jgi:hypothetical protein
MEISAKDDVSKDAMKTAEESEIMERRDVETSQGQEMEENINGKDFHKQGRRQSSSPPPGINFESWLTAVRRSKRQRGKSSKKRSEI